VTRLLAILAGVLGVLLVPLALSGPTALLLVPAHLAFAALVCVGAVWEGLDGAPERARRWGFGFLVATIAMVGALQVGAEVHGQGMGYWGAPWLAALCWSGVPPVASGLAGWYGSHRVRRQRPRQPRPR
jgi:hypothetical protein